MPQSSSVRQEEPHDDDRLPEHSDIRWRARCDEQWRAQQALWNAEQD